MPGQEYPTDPDRFFAVVLPSTKEVVRPTQYEMDHMSPAQLLAAAEARK